MKYGGVGGGDIKLTSALGFCIGLYGLMVILFFALVHACLYAKVTSQKSVPLAVFLCIGFFIYISIVFVNGLLVAG
jgi:leader peptidase (prepilin peptidase)/N-methyltransferase